MNDLRLDPKRERKTDCKGRNFIWYKQNLYKLIHEIIFVKETKG